MRRLPRWTSALLLSLLPAAGCGPSPHPSPPAPAQPPAATNVQRHLNQAQPRLRTVQLYLGSQEITAEVALTRTETATGMMFRESMQEGEGMLFVFGQPHQAGFYMKNTTVPLSVAYIDAEGILLEIHDLEPLNEDPVLSSTDQVQYVLEVPRGWFQRHNISEGTYLRTEHGSLQETFFGPDRVFR